MKTKLTTEGAVIYFPDKYLTLRLTKEETLKELRLKQLPDDYPGPEVVHLEVSNKCNLRCSYCYVKKENKELTTYDWMRIIYKLAKEEVFQVTFGGGEPTLRDDIIELASYTKRVGLNLAMTSNGILVPYFGKELRNFDQINVSFHRSNINPFGILTKALSYLKKLKIKRGISFCLRKDYYNDLDKVVDIAKKYEAELLLLTYKPIINDYENYIPPITVYDVAETLKDKVEVAVDGLTCSSCMGNKRFCDVDSEGNVYPCSFIRIPQGNLLTEKLVDIWNKRIKNIKCPFS